MSQGEADATTAELLDAYRRMRRIRAFEETVLRLGAEGVVAGATHLCGGQEAVPVGAHRALEPGDRVVATYRGHGWALESGADLVAVLAEICHKDGGTNGGRAGSAMISAPEHGFIGENAIVGAGVPIAAGVAKAALSRGRGRVALVSIGDGAVYQGATTEGITFAAGYGLPLIVICENNGWAEMTPGDKFRGGKSVTERVAGFGIDCASVDGNDPIAVRDAVAHATAKARAGEGPTFIECRTVRLMAHYNLDIEHYRRRSEVREEREQRDPLTALRTRVVAAGGDDAALDRIDAEVRAEIGAAEEAVKAQADPAVETARQHVRSAAGEATPTPAPAPRETKTLKYDAAVTAALREELATRPEVLVYGEDLGVAGGVFGITRNLQREFGEERVFDTPIAESGILGSALGASLEGMRPIVEIMWADFMLVALDQLVNQAANVRYLSRGTQSAPMVVRTQQGITEGSCSQHVQSLEALLTHIPGLKVGLPATPQDAYSMLRAAVADEDPCIVIESRLHYGDEAQVQIGGQAEPVGGAVLRRPGRDAVIVCWATMVAPALAAAAALAEGGADVGVLDLRWLNPLDDEALAAAVKAASGRVLVAHEANLTGGFGAEIVARIAERQMTDLKAVRRIGLEDTRVPASPTLQAALVPDADEIAAAVRDLIEQS